MGEKTVRYEIRDRVEEIIKKKKIDRTRFYEYSKTDYQKVITNFYYAYADYQKYPKVSMDHMWLHVRENLKQQRIALISERDYGYEKMVRSIKEQMHYNWEHKLFLILEGWVYEGYIDEMLDILAELDILDVSEFYIVTPKYDKVALYTDDGECVCVWE